jgi:hypothetical protein
MMVFITLIIYAKLSLVVLNLINNYVFSVLLSSILFKIHVLIKNVDKLLIMNVFIAFKVFICMENVLKLFQIV